ncbi:MAG: adenosylcobinamide-phosphate synthase CbiB [Rhizobiaceae bacterium]
MALLALALIIDWWVGDPDWLWRRMKHPVVWFGAVIAWFDRNCDMYREKSAVGGRDSTLIWWGLALISALFTCAAAVSALIYGLKTLVWPLGIVLELIVIVVFVAQKSLRDHVRRVADALREDGVPGGRKALAMIVGRDVSQLDESGVSKAAIESLAENFSDGILAPAFWYAVGGLPWLIFYKAVNTADSMIGHRTERYEHFGKPAAKLDDLMNWIPARLSLLLVMLATATWYGVKRAFMVWTVTRNDARRHRSPNAGWPETAFASSLGLQLGGPRSYADHVVDGAVLNTAGRKNATAEDIDKALDLFGSVCFQLPVLAIILWFALG